ncbi:MULTISPECIES: ferritin-like domain-containing protein [unclassified Rhizobium]|uniref:YciE/YciF ferroxidase family protein n=1 Tax=unclassified Rhizobium TaxID=2613769 RepID=UPI0009E82E75|nr:MULTISPECIES: ferritin-like domain-containing protein [unclassified Rhizobium]
MARLLEDLFLDTLRDVYFAEQKIFATLPEMEQVASNAQLKSALRKHLDETKVHVTRLEAIFNVIGAEPEAKTCDAILGITDEAAEIMEEYHNSPALDAGLLAAAQAVEHYEMSRYGTLRTWALELGYEEAAEILQTTLNEEEAADLALTTIAISVVNRNAEGNVEPVVEDSDGKSSDLPAVGSFS